LEIRPEVAIAKMAAEQMSSLAAEFGLTPASRARLGIATTHKDIDIMEALRNENNNGGN
jgi:phage terminase small subunit